MCLQATANYKDGFANPDTQTDTETTDVLDESKDVANSAPLANNGSVVEPRQRANQKPTFTKEDANDDGTMEDGSADNPFLRNVDENEKDAVWRSTLGVTDDGGGAGVLLWSSTVALTRTSFEDRREDGTVEVRLRSWTTRRSPSTW